jgi:pimeloyl-ACP methyl ester carboxylesterase
MPDWLNARPSPADRLRLFCFHHAGGGASAFRGWQDVLAPGIAVYPVQLPGREGRVRERRITDLTTVVTEIEEALGPWLDRPYAFYGHSMGALIAHALTGRLLVAGKRLPERLLVGAFPGPMLGAPLAGVPDMSDEALTDLLVRIGGMSDTVRATRTGGRPPSPCSGLICGSATVPGHRLRRSCPFRSRSSPARTIPSFPPRTSQPGPDTGVPESAPTSCQVAISFCTMRRPSCSA